MGMEIFLVIYSLRMLIEVDCCRLAMIHANDHEMENLKKQLDRYLAAKKECQEKGTEESMQALCFFISNNFCNKRNNKTKS